MIPLGYWYFVYKDSQNNIKGAKVTGFENGAYVAIDSKGGTWELNSYLCKSRSECLESLSSGTKLETKGGGHGQNYEVEVVYKNEWDNYDFLKLFVRSGWGAPSGHYGVVDRGVVTGTSVEEIKSDGVSYEVVLIPTKELKNGFYKSVEFSD